MLLSSIVQAWSLDESETGILRMIYDALGEGRKGVTDSSVLLLHTGVSPTLLYAAGELLGKGSITVVSHQATQQIVMHDMARTLRTNLRVAEVANQVELHRVVAINGPFNLIVDMAYALETDYRLKLRLLFFPALAEDGNYILAGLNNMPAEERRHVIDYHGRLAKLIAGTDKNTGGDINALSQQIELLGLTRHAAIANRRGCSYIKLRHGETDQILSARYGEGWGQTLLRRESNQYESAALLWTNRPELAEERLMTTIRCPEISVREYRCVRVLPRQIVGRDNLLYPDTFRLGGLKRLRNSALTEVNHYYASVPDEQKQQDSLSGTFFHLDLE